MLKISATVFTLISLLAFTFLAPVSAQNASTNYAPADAVAKSNDLKKIFDAEGRKLSAEHGRFNPARDDRDNAQGQAKKGGWSKSEKILLGAFIVGVAVLVVVLLKYGKNCVRTSTPGCNIGTDENCFCEEYEPSR